LAVLLQLEGLTVRFGGVEALAAVDLALEPGSSLGLMGPNGCGKTTLFNAVSGIVRPASGRILFRGGNIVGLPAHRIARLGVARTFQTVRLFERMTALENTMPAFARAEVQAVMQSLERVKLAHRSDALASELSIFEQRRLELARALAPGPHLVLMDEPTAGLSPEETEEMVALIRDRVLPACAVILTEHKPDVVAALCRTAVLLDQGRKVAAAPPRQLFAGAAFRAAYLGMVDSGGVSGDNR
jgi:branched-chain amino acid transport system ATP-binding protein